MSDRYPGWPGPYVRAAFDAVQDTRPVTLSWDEMTWPLPDSELEHKFRHGVPSMDDNMRAASIIAAYREILFCPQSKAMTVRRRVRAFFLERCKR